MLANLRDLFKFSAKKHNEAILEGDSITANEALDQLSEAYRKLKEMGDEGRQAIEELMDSPDVEVRAMAAAYSLNHNTEKALAVLRAIAIEDKGLLGFRAEQAIKRWYEGNWKIQ